MTEEKRDFSARFSFCLQSPQTAKIALKQIGVNYRRGLICRTILNGFFLSALWFWLLNRIQVSLQNSDFLMNVLRPFCFDIHWKRGSTDRTPFKKASLLTTHFTGKAAPQSVSKFTPKGRPFFRFFSKWSMSFFRLPVCPLCARLSLVSAWLCDFAPLFPNFSPNISPYALSPHPKHNQVKLGKTHCRYMLLLLLCLWTISFTVHTLCYAAMSSWWGK